MTQHDSIALFESTEIRKVWHEEQWYFSIIDIISALTSSQSPRRYWSDLKIKLSEEGIQTELYDFFVQLKLMAPDGKMRETDCVNTEGILRIIQSVPSPRAEPFKQWLAKVGYERIQEIEDPELAQQRMKMLYEQKWYPADWIDKRLRGIAIRQNLTDEWRERGITEQRDYAILTAEISHATFGMTPSEYREYKDLPTKSKTNLRDHMTDLELIFTMLGERVTTEISTTEKPAGLHESKKVAQRGGKVAGNARKETEKELGRSVITKKNLIENTSQKLIP